MIINKPIIINSLIYFISLIVFMNICHANPIDNISLSTLSGENIVLLNDDPVGIMTRPLRKTKERWNIKYHASFLQFRKIDMTYIGKEISGKLKVNMDSSRLTIYQISRQNYSDNMVLRVISTGFYNKNDIVKFNTKIESLNNNIYIITSEKTLKKDHLNSHLTYMNKQNDSIKLSGYGTNWSLNKLKLNLTGITNKKSEDSFTKDADWLVNQLLEPQWVIFIRADRNK